MEIKMKVLSLFDGISCGRLALERAGIPVERYVAYEIDENAIKVSKANWDDIEHCGDVTKADFAQYKGFDLLILVSIKDLMQLLVVFLVKTYLLTKEIERGLRVSVVACFGIW